MHFFVHAGVHVSGCLSPAQAALEGRIVFMRADVYAPNAELLGPCFKVRTTARHTISYLACSYTQLQPHMMACLW